MHRRCGACTYTRRTSTGFDTPDDSLFFSLILHGEERYVILSITFISTFLFFSTGDLIENSKQKESRSSTDICTDTTAPGGKTGEIPGRLLDERHPRILARASTRIYACMHASMDSRISASTPPTKDRICVDSQGVYSSFLPSFSFPLSCSGKIGEGRNWRDDEIVFFLLDSPL